MRIGNWVFKRVRRVRRRRNTGQAFFVRRSKAEYIQHKERARALVTQKLLDFNTFYNFNVGKIAIRNQKSRWGSCSKKGNLNFNYRLTLIPENLVDYVVVHELCHIGEFNHSKDFWGLVSKNIPYYTNARTHLKKFAP